MTDHSNTTCRAESFFEEQKALTTAYIAKLDRKAAVAKPARTPDPWHKSAKLAKPHATFTSAGWTWRVLKSYSSPEGEKRDRYARWFCFVTSPMCPEGEYGDTYIREIPGATPGQRA